MRQRKQKHYYDRGTKPLKPLAVDDDVHVRLGREHISAVVTGTHNTHRTNLHTELFFTQAIA